MTSGNMRVLARTSDASGSAVTFNSSNMVGCTIFCIQWVYFAGGTITGEQNIGFTINGDSTNAYYHNVHHDMDYNLAASSSILKWNVDENPNVPYLYVGGKPIASDGASGETWVKANLRDSSYTMWTQRNVCWTNNNDIAARSQVGWFSQSGQVTSITYTPSSGTVHGFNAILWGGVD